MDERIVIERCQAGEMDAFDELLGCYEGLVYNLARRYFGNQPEVADIAQDAMIKLFLHIGEFRWRSTFKTWVYRVVTNVCLDHLRQRKAYLVSLDGPNEDGRPMLELPEEEPGPEDMAEREQLREILADILRTLPHDHRVILVLRDMEELSYEEIAEVLGCSLGTVKSRLARARDALRRKFLASSRAAGWAERKLQA
jgi:RNA polymerase sigma-70 factor (ECF subfamily)